MSLEERVKQIDGYAGSLAKALLIMDQRRRILEPLLTNEEIKGRLRRKVDRRAGAAAYNHIVPLMAQDLVRDLARLFLDNDKRTASLTNTVRKASDPELSKALRERFSRIPEKWNPVIEGVPPEVAREMMARMAAENKAEYEASFDDGMKSVMNAVQALQKDPVVAKLKTFRDKYHSHFEIAPLGKDPEPFDVKSLGLTYSDILAFADRYMEAAFELIRVILGSIYALPDYVKAHREQGEDFWSALVS